MTAFRIEIDGPCVVTLTHEPGGVIRQEIRQGERVIHIAEFDGAPKGQTWARGEVSAPEDPPEPGEILFDEGPGERAEGSYSAAALRGPDLLEAARRREPLHPAPRPRPREV